MQQYTKKKHDLLCVFWGDFEWGWKALDSRETKEKGRGEDSGVSDIAVAQG